MDNTTMDLTETIWENVDWIFRPGQEKLQAAFGVTRADPKQLLNS
jgi:hypothetical protein